MKWREQEAKASAQKQETTTVEATLFPPLDGTDTSAMQDTVSDTDLSDKPEIRDVPDGETAEEPTTDDVDVPAERTIARRISGKQRRLSLEEYRATYLKVPKLVNRKPVFVILVVSFLCSSARRCETSWTGLSATSGSAA